jgi:hypothetical protein
VHLDHDGLGVAQNARSRRILGMPVGGICTSGMGGGGSFPEHGFVCYLCGVHACNKRVKKTFKRKYTIFHITMLWELKKLQTSVD